MCNTWELSVRHLTEDQRLAVEDGVNGDTGIVGGDFAEDLGVDDDDDVDDV